MDASLRLTLPRVIGPATTASLGLSRQQVRTEVARGTWRLLARGVLLTRPDVPTRDDWADAGVLLAGPDAAVTGWDAARCYGLAKTITPPSLVVVVSPSAMNRVVGGVRISRTTRSYEQRRRPDRPYDEPCVVDPTRAVIDTALACRRLGDVHSLVGRAVQQRLCTTDELLTEFADCPRRGSRLTRLALGDLRDGARSAAEAVAAHKLASGPVPPFELNVPVVDQHGTTLYVVDVLWRAVRAALEIDSREYHFGVGEWEATLARHNALTRLGLAVTHYPPRLVTRRDSTFVPEIAAWLRARAAELGLALPPGHGVRRPVGETPPPYLVRAA